MINLKAITILMKITARLDLKPAINALQELDIFEATDDKAEAIAQLNAENAYKIAVSVLPTLMPQLDIVADFLPQLVAAYKHISVTEAEEADAIETLKEICTDEGLRAFFSTALRKKAGLKH